MTHYIDMMNSKLPLKLWKNKIITHADNTTENYTKPKVLTHSHAHMQAHTDTYTHAHARTYIHARTRTHTIIPLTEIWSNNDLQRELDEWRPSANTITPRASSSGLHTVNIFIYCVWCNWLNLNSVPHSQVGNLQIYVLNTRDEKQDEIQLQYMLNKFITWTSCH